MGDGHLGSALLRKGLLGVASLSTAQGAAIVGSIVTIAILGRYLGAVEFGQYYALFSLVALSALLTDFGLNTIVIREGARRPASMGRLIEEGMPLRLVLGAGAALVGLAYAAAVWRTPEFMLLVAVTSASVVVGGFASLFSTVLNVRHEFSMLSVLRVVQAVLTLGFTVAAVLLDLGLGGVVLAQVSSVAVMTLLFYRIAKSRASFRLRLGRINWGMARAAAWFGLTSALTFAFGRLSVLLGSIYLSPEALGHYSAAYGVAEQMSLLVTNLVAGFFPLVAPRMALGEVSQAQLVRYAVLLAAVAAPVVGAVWILAEPVLSILYGDQFAAAAPALRILAWSFLIAMASVPASMAADATDNQRIHAFNSSYMGAATVLLIVLLAPPWGIVGLALAVVVGRGLGVVVGTPVILAYLKFRGAFDRNVDRANAGEGPI